MPENTLQFVPLSASREEHPHLARRFTFTYLEAIITDETITFVRVSSGRDDETFTLSREDFDELGAAYEQFINGKGPHERVYPAKEINERGVALLQRPRPAL